MQSGSIHKYRACQDNCPAQAAFYKTIGGIWILITSCWKPNTSHCNFVYSCSVPVLFNACKIWYVFSMWSGDLGVFYKQGQKNWEEQRASRESSQRVGGRRRERRVQRNDLWRSDSLAVSAAAQKPNRADTDTHGQMKAPPRAMKVTPCDVDNGSQWRMGPLQALVLKMVSTIRTQQL